VSDEPDRQAIVEALLFVTKEPLSLAKLQEILADADPATIEETIRALALRLEADQRGLIVQEVAGGYRLATRPDLAPWVMKLQEVKPARLSRAALETLAIIAYRQPITRPEIEAIRGVSVDGVMRTLLERELIRMMGRKADAGRPMLYGTTQLFLEHFGLKGLGDLPTLKEINELITASADSTIRAAAPDGTDEPQPAASHAAATDGEDGFADGTSGPADVTPAAPAPAHKTAGPASDATTPDDAASSGNASPDGV
jgi:segregation and condensation protein B